MKKMPLSKQRDLAWTFNGKKYVLLQGGVEIGTASSIHAVLAKFTKIRNKLGAPQHKFKKAENKPTRTPIKRTQRGTKNDSR